MKRRCYIWVFLASVLFILGRVNSYPDKDDSSARDESDDTKIKKKTTKTPQTPEETSKYMTRTKVTARSTKLTRTTMHSLTTTRPPNNGTSKIKTETPQTGQTGSSKRWSTGSAAVTRKSTRISSNRNNNTSSPNVIDRTTKATQEIVKPLSGATEGGVAAGVVGAAVLTVVIVALCLKRRRNRTKRSNHGQFSSQNEDSVNVTSSSSPQARSHKRDNCKHKDVRGRKRKAAFKYHKRATGGTVEPTVYSLAVEIEREYKGILNKMARINFDPQITNEKRGDEIPNDKESGSRVTGCSQYSHAHVPPAISPKPKVSISDVQIFFEGDGGRKRTPMKDSCGDTNTKRQEDAHKTDKQLKVVCSSSNGDTYSKLGKNDRSEGDNVYDHSNGQVYDRSVSITAKTPAKLDTYASTYVDGRDVTKTGDNSSDLYDVTYNKEAVGNVKGECTGTIRDDVDPEEKCFYNKLWANHTENRDGNVYDHSDGHLYDRSISVNAKPPPKSDTYASTYVAGRDVTNTGENIDDSYDATFSNKKVGTVTSECTGTVRDDARTEDKCLYNQLWANHTHSEGGNVYDHSDGHLYDRSMSVTTKPSPKADTYSSTYVGADNLHNGWTDDLYDNAYSKKRTCDE